MGRRLHPSGRPQHQKSKERIGESFSIYRPVCEESAEEIYETLQKLKSSADIPENAEIRTPGSMRVTYVEKSKMSRTLQGFAAGFDARAAANRVTDHEDQSRRLDVSIGRVTLMDRRDETVVARIDHSQAMAEEFRNIIAGLAMANLPRATGLQFRPHISLVRLPGLTYPEKKFFAEVIQTSIPEEVTLMPLDSDPKNPGLRRK